MPLFPTMGKGHMNCLAKGKYKHNLREMINISTVSLFGLFVPLPMKRWCPVPRLRDMWDLKPTCSLEAKVLTHPNFLREGKKTAFSDIFEATLLWFLRHCMSSQKQSSLSAYDTCNIFPFLSCHFNEAGQLALPISPLFQSPLYDCSSWY